MQMKLDWLSATLSGLMIGAISIISSVSFAALVFAGPLSEHLDYGLNVALITAVVTGLFVAFGSSCRIAISLPQDRTAPILAIMVTAITAAAPADASGEHVLLSIIALIIATSLVTGISLLGLGLARAGGLMRFIPYAVLGGFFAGTGWLLVIGGLRVMSGLELATLDSMLQLADPDLLVRWLPGLALAIAILVASRFIASGIAFFTILFAALGVFFLITLNNGGTLETLGSSGWLLGPFERQVDNGYLLGLPQLLGVDHWSVVFDQWANIGTVVVISATSIMLTVSGLEMLTHRDIDINHELRVSGLANLATGLGGGMVGFHSLSISELALKLGARHRATGVIAALTAAVALFFGTELIGHIPRIVVGGLLLFIGFSFLGKWLFGSWGKLPHSEYLVIPLILFTIAAVGFIEGLILGLLAALIQFVLKYSRTTVIRYALSGKEAKSAVERNMDDDHFLVDQGPRLLVLKLQGYLFFGTTAQLSSRVKARLADASQPALRYLVLDFQAVHGIDSSAAYEFHRLRLMAEEQDFIIVMTGMPQAMRRQLRSGNIFKANAHIQEFDDLDRGLEWCEEQLLATVRTPRSAAAKTALQHLADALPAHFGLTDVLAYLSEVIFGVGDELIRQGEASRDMFFLERGDVSVYLKPASGEAFRIRQTGPGTVMGELGFYLDTPRSASVIAETAGTAYRLTTEGLNRMETEHPELAAALHRFIADLLAERLLRTTHTLERVLH